MSLQNNSCETYQYNGPAEYHALVGQVLAGLGYVGGKENVPVGAVVSLFEIEGKLRLQCLYGKNSSNFLSSEAWIFDRKREKAHIRNILIRMYQRMDGHEDDSWGTLQGVRPTKLVHRMLDQGNTLPFVREYLQKQYDVSEKNAAYLTDIAAVQRPYVMPVPKQISVYIGIPYCSSHCLYCSFPSRLIGAEQEERLKLFVRAVRQDIEAIHDICVKYGLSVHTVYVGGGTPTSLPWRALKEIMHTAYGAFGAVQEWTVEAGRPDTATAEKLSLLRQYGADRISINPQTMQQRLLDALGRKHRIEDIYSMYSTCRALGFRVINMDFMAGLPYQTAEDMQENMEIVCQLHPENVTIHTLALKKRAPLFHHDLRRFIPPAETVRCMLACCRETLKAQGYIPYYMYRQTYMAASFANTGYALPDALGIYNMEMMEERQSVLGAGPGSATKCIAPDGQRLQKMYMPKSIEDYAARLDEKIRERQRLCAIMYGGEDG